MSPKTARIVVAAVVVVLLAYIGLTGLQRMGQGQAQEQSEPPPKSAEASGLPAGDPTAVASANAEADAQATEVAQAGGDPQDDPVDERSAQEIHASLDPDPQSAEEVTEAWLTAYSTRDEADEQLWEETTTDWTSEELYDELAEADDEEIASHAPTRVTAVTVGDHVREWGADTPIRWSHQVRVTFQDEEGQSFDNAYRVQAQRGDEGWIINSMSFTGITAENEEDEDEEDGDDPAEGE